MNQKRDIYLHRSGFFLPVEKINTICAMYSIEWGTARNNSRTAYIQKRIKDRQLISG